VVGQYFALWGFQTRLTLARTSLHTLTQQHTRFARVTRPYSATQVVSKRGTLTIQYPSDLQAKKLWSILEKHAKDGTVSHTYGA
jgi:isocitrate lyase